MRLARMAEFDTLTGLPNRRGLERLLPRMLAAARGRENSGVVVLLGVEGLRRLKDVYGHYTFERIVQTTASRLRAQVPADAILARVGVDEFVVAMPISGSELKAEAEVVRLQALLREPLEVDGKDHYLMASAGLSGWPSDSTNPSDLLQMAEAALAQSRKRGKGQFCRFGSQAVLLSRRRNLENLLRMAVVRGELRLSFQPQVDLSGHIVGAETLLSWQSSQLGPVSTGEFISVAEESGLIIPIGHWVRKQACLQFNAWIQAGYRPGILAVNVSPLEFEHPDFVSGILKVLEETGIDARSVELELTERLVLNNLETAERKMNQVGQTGVRFALDDFGTGYSSLIYLRGLSVHTLKIDRGFVERIATPSGTLPLIHTMVILAHNLGLRTVAEGVETKEQWEMLRAARCDAMQGFLFGRALDADAYSELLASGAPLGGSL